MRPVLISFLAATALVACSKPGSGEVPLPNTGDPLTGLPSGTNTGTTTGTTAGTTTGGTTPTYDCSVLPPVPAYYTTLTGFSTAEDFDLDGDGYAVAEYSGSLAGKDLYGNTKVLAGNLGGWTAGTRVLSTGDFVVANAGQGSLMLIDPTTGSNTTIASGMSYPNGVEVDSLDNIYTADQDRGTLVRVNAYNTSDTEVIATGLAYPNGVILSPDETIAYVGSFGGGVIYKIEKDPAGGWFAPVVLAQSPGWDGGFDGINVDICGNVYFTEYIAGKVRRVTPDGLQVDLVAELPSYWIPNIRWGHDIGGWRSDVMYVSDREQGRIFALEIGLPGKRHILMP